MRPTLLLIAALIAACGGGGAPPPQIPPPRPHAEPAPPAGHDKADQIRVRVPQPGALVQSPLHVEGEARGPWFFEATFPVTLVDAQGRELVRGYAEARAEWMTEAFVPFEANLVFTAGNATAGTLVLDKANPSGLPEQADALRVPVRFGSAPH